MRKLLALTSVSAFLIVSLPGVTRAQESTPAKPHTSTTPAKPKTATTTKRPAASAGARPLTLTTQQQKFSYALGLSLGKNMHRQSVEIQPDIVARGIKDGVAGGKALLTDEEAQAVVMAVQNDVRAKQQEKMKDVGDKNKQEGAAFLAANKNKEGVVTLPSGLQYKILTQGTGPKPTANDSVVCNYRGTLIDGKEFDSSYKRGQPATFPVGRVIKGWTEALQLMPVGSKWQLFVPAELGYGERGAGADIGPDATLIFEVELLSIQPAAK
jgi:FKBP-type peptidyl-prolyl cis-trans isomerase